MSWRSGTRIGPKILETCEGCKYLDDKPAGMDAVYFCDSPKLDKPKDLGWSESPTPKWCPERMVALVK